MLDIVNTFVCDPSDGLDVRGDVGLAKPYTVGVAVNAHVIELRVHDGVVELLTFRASDEVLRVRVRVGQDCDGLMFVFVGGTAWYISQVFDCAT